MSPDPYWGSATTDRSGSLNRYAYAEGDPVNANDPSGLCINSNCFNFEPVEDGPVFCGLCDLDVMMPEMPPVGRPEIGIPGLSDILKEMQSGRIPKQTIGEWTLSVNRTWATIVAAFMEARKQSDKRRYPRYLRPAQQRTDMPNDCWAPGSELSGTYVRYIAYEVLDDDGRRMDGSALDDVIIGELFPVQVGNLDLNGGQHGTWSYANLGLHSTGWFRNTLSTGGFLSGTSRSGEALQIFTARFQGTYGTPYPLMVTGMGDSTTVLHNTYAPGMITVNGTTTTTPCFQ